MTSTVNGRLRLVKALRDGTRMVLDEAPTSADLAELIGALRQASTSDAPVADAVARVQAFPRLEAWARENPATAKLIEGLLIVVLTVLATRLTEPEPPEKPAPAPVVEVVIERPSDEELQRLIDEALDRREMPPGPAAP